MCRLLFALLGVTAIIQLATANSCSNIGVCTRTRQVSCGMWGWSSCAQSYTVSCNEEVACTYDYSIWSSCSATCGPGTRTRTVTCQQDNCPRKSFTETGNCEVRKCPVDGVWSAWSAETCDGCSVTCGVGQSVCSQTRTCDPPRHGGKNCEGISSKSRTKNCDTNIECPIDGGWGDWSELTGCGGCSKSCGTGKQRCTRNRSCNNPAPMYGGANCKGDSQMTESPDCNTHPCPIDGGWGDWSELTGCGECSKSCGTGKQRCTRNRSCNNPAPMYGGANCKGDSQMTESPDCNTHPCPIHGGWGDWSEWVYTPCSKTCCTGFQSRTKNRRCDSPAPMYGGKDCTGEVSETQHDLPCNIQVCPIACNEVGVFVRDPCMNCSATYYVCDTDSEAREMTCAKGLFWNSDISTCTPTCADAEPEDEACQDGFHLVADSGCKKYYQCHNGRQFSDLECPGDTWFNMDVKTCDIPPNRCPTGVDEETVEETVETCENGYHVDLEADSTCKAFYQCYNGIQFSTLHCPGDTWFNMDVKICDIPPNRCSTGVDEETEEETVDETGEFSCSGQADGFYANENDTSFYIWCVAGQRNDMPCPAGLVFNSILKMCDWPAP